MGYCRYCGQAVIDTDTDDEASAECLCYEAKRARKLRAAAGEAKESIENLFGEGAGERGLVALNRDIISALFSVVDLLGAGEIRKVSLNIPGICSVNMSVSDTSIKIERSESRKISNVAGEK